MSAPVRVRFAPSPTGPLHIGGLRTALYNWLFARKHGGTVVLRIEDTDRSRFVEQAEEDIIESLHWVGLDFDEGPGLEGPFGPYRQSERADVYREHAERLVAEGHAYHAFDTPDEIDAMRRRLQEAGGRTQAYNAATRGEMTNSFTLPPDDVQARLDRGHEHVIRLDIPQNETVRFEDMVRGEVAFETDTIDDQILIKSDGMPTYHLANVIDDHLMEISHVIRGEEWLPSVPKHLLLYRFLGWEPPRMAHLPLIMSPTGGKLSKRNADKMGIPVAVKDYREAGFEPAALINFLALLGWNPGDDRELFSLDELVEAYSIERTGQSGAQFDLPKLHWFNGQRIRRMDLDELVERATDQMHRLGLDHPIEKVEVAARLMQDRIEFAQDIFSSGAYLFEDPESFDEAGLKKRWKDDSADLVTAYADRIGRLASFDEASLEAELRALAEEREVGAGRIIHPVRLATSGVTSGPGLFEMMVAIGPEATERRLRHAAQTLG